MSDNKPTSEIVPSESSSQPTRSRSLDPFSMFSEMEEMMDRMLGRNWPFMRPIRRFTQSSSGWSPHVDMYEEGNDIVVKAELPGLTKDDIDVQIENGDLVIKGERKSDSEVKEENYYRMERSFGTFYRNLPLPEGIQAGQISATFKDGVLEVRAPKPVSTGPTATKISVQ